MLTCEGFVIVKVIKVARWISGEYIVLGTRIAVLVEPRVWFSVAAD